MVKSCPLSIQPLSSTVWLNSQEVQSSLKQTRDKVLLHQGGHWQEEEGPGWGRDTDEPVSGQEMTWTLYKSDEINLKGSRRIINHNPSIILESSSVLIQWWFHDYSRWLKSSAYLGGITHFWIKIKHMVITNNKNNGLEMPSIFRFDKVFNLNNLCPSYPI